MTEHKFTDEEVIKALELCFTPKGTTVTCAKCPYHPFGKMCKIMRDKDALDLLNRQKAEVAYWQDAAANAKRETAREIFEEIEKVIGDKYESYVFDNNDLDSIEQDAIINFSDEISDSFEEIKKKYTEEQK